MSYLDKIPDSELPELSCLSTILSRARLVKAETINHGYLNFYQCLLNLLDSNLSTGINSCDSLSLASLSFTGDNENHDYESQLQGKWLLRADPVFIAPDRDQLIMTRIEEADLSMSEAEQLVDQINGFFKSYQEESFWTLKAVNPQRWYIISDKAIELDSAPPEKVYGKPLKNFLPSGKDSDHWRNLFNEFQMILHQSPVNQMRIQSKKLPINSLWLWGAVPYIAQEALKSQCVFDKVYTNNPVATGLARQGDADVSELQAYQSSMEDSYDNRLYVIESPGECLHNQDLFSWVSELKKLEHDFFKPLLSDLKSGKLRQLELVSPSGNYLTIDRKHLRRWWKKIRPFKSFYTISTSTVSST